MGAQCEYEACLFDTVERTNVSLPKTPFSRGSRIPTGYAVIGGPSSELLRRAGWHETNPQKR